jgi:hypothetical protein
MKKRVNSKNSAANINKFFALLDNENSIHFNKKFKVSSSRIAIDY